MTQIKQADDLAARAERRWWRFIIPASLLILALVVGFLWFSRAPEGCRIFNLSPVETGMTAQDPPQPWAIYQVPVGQFAVIFRDGFYSAVGTGERFMDKQGYYLCNDSGSASKAAAKLNAALAQEDDR